MYNYQASTTNFSAVANGDLNGDTSLSTFILAGGLQNTGAAGGSVLTIAPSIQEVNPED
jgi:hypothetical protein